MIRIGLLLPVLALASAAQSQGLSALKGHNSNAPVDVSADRIEVQDRANQAVFVGRVHAVQGDLVMDSARMTVNYARAQTPGADPQIQRIDASGGVVVTDPSERAQGSFGIYDLNRGIITLIGNVTLTRANNVVRGARLVIDTNTGRATVDGSAVGGGTSAAPGGRVTGRFTVPQRKPATATPPATGATPPK
jgi:lipopolysaccharide export system protein LptA